VKRYKKYGINPSWTVIKFGKYGRNSSWIVKKIGKYGRQVGNSEMILKIWKKSKLKCEMI
jgi:hypothetical protein